MAVTVVNGGESAAAEQDNGAEACSEEDAKVIDGDDGQKEKE